MDRSALAALIGQTGPVAPSHRSVTTPKCGVVVEIPEAELVVGQHRLRLDSSAAGGLPAHVTVIFPFVQEHELDRDVVSRLARAVATVPAFRYRFEHTKWFGSRVLWLAPDDSEPFANLTHAVLSEFPDLEPYNGEVTEIIPHLTVGYDRELAELQEAETALQLEPAVVGEASTVVVMCAGSDGVWQRRLTLPLG